MNALVSVIIPVYNVEKYIEKCMQSLLDQTYTNFEALIVDDGSPDNSIAVAKSLVGNDPRFIFFEKENGGQGSARNLALDNTKGDYIAFLDSDDYYDNKYLSVMLEKIIEENADICICNSNLVDESGDVIRVHKNNLPLYYSKKDCLLAFRTISNYMWDKIFRVSCFSNFRFDPTIRTYEDVHLLFRIMYQKTMISINDVLYNYVQRQGSTMNSLPKSYVEDRHEIYLEVKEFYYRELKDSEEYKEHIMHHYLNNFMFDCSINIVKYSNNYNEDIKKLLSKSDGLFNTKSIVTNRTLPKNNKVALLILKSNPKAFEVFIRKWLSIRHGEKL